MALAADHPPLRLDRTAWLQILAEAWRVYPEEACGVLVGPAGTGEVRRFEPIANAEASTRVFTLDGQQFAKAALRADRDDLDVIGVVHSHTHTPAQPSPTDEAEARKPLVPPTWYWAIASIENGAPELRAHRVDPAGAGMVETTVVLTD